MLQAQLIHMLAVPSCVPSQQCSQHSLHVGKVDVCTLSGTQISEGGAQALSAVSSNSALLGLSGTAAGQTGVYILSISNFSLPSTFSSKLILDLPVSWIESCVVSPVSP